METALFYYGYTDRNPSEWNFAIDKMVSKGRTEIEYPFIKAYRVEPSLLILGETKGVIDGEIVRIYAIDRTICDVLRNMNKMDKEIFNKAIQRYVNDEQKNIPNLMKYAKKLRVQKKSKRLDRSVAIMADIVASVLAKLRNKAKRVGISYQHCMQLFVQEEFLRKLSKSGYDNNLVLKGCLSIP